ncbi:type VII secretion-associated serine protease mycosin, partial [Streptomyces blattellae]|uniref:type VII secretion-associated serine protease mycosin n=1 Tax=Streptomyces blattellae TaxID=2569855 RepID=UPI002287305D
MTLTGALLLTTAPTASADYVRDQQWALNAFAAEDVWAESQGEGVTVAVVDSGVDSDHPDLSGQVLEGRDFTGGGSAKEDVFGHGTAMASVIAAHGHGAGRDSGMIGLAPKAKILPLRTYQKENDKNPDAVWSTAVRYAVDQGAKVINLSFGADGGKTSSEGREAIAYAQARDVVVVAAAGNNGAVAVEEPAALPGVISVGAIDENANRWIGSNSGKGLTLMAPGVQVLSADPESSQGYSLSDGTSDATAYVSAAAALVRSKYPDLSAGQVINRLIKSATFAHHEGLKAPDEEYGYGIVRPYSALTMDIPAGPKENPLGQLQSSDSSSGETDTSNQAEEEESSSSNVLVIAGGIAAVVVVMAIFFAVIRSRRNRGNNGPGPGGGFPPQGTGYPPQSPTGYQPYPNAAPPNQGYPTPPGQPPQHPNPYAQQPPHQG